MKKAPWLLALLCIIAQTAGAAVHDPDREWRTGATEHFVFHYPEKLSPQAGRLAAAAEKIHPVMTRLSGWEPAIPTEVVLLDDTDEANGSATVLGRPTIILHAVEPTFGDTIADTGDWMNSVFIHEYAHILNLDYRAEYSKFFTGLFGRVEMPFSILSALPWLLAVPPEGLMPPWAIEGSAVNFETDLTGRGRLNSTWFAMLYRSDVAENAIPTLDRLGGDYPGGHSYNARYLYGSRLMNQFTEKKGVGGLGDLFRAQASRVPYSIEKPALDATGADYPALHAKMANGLNAQYGPVIVKIREAGETLPALLTTDANAAGGPRWLDADRIIFTRDDPWRPPLLTTFKITTGATETITERPGPNNKPSLAPDGTLLFTMDTAERPWAGTVTSNALYALHPTTSTPEKVTEGFRVRHADGNPSRNVVVVVLQEENGQRLALLDLEQPAKLRRTLLAEPATRYDNPALSPDGRFVAVSRKTSEGKERLALIDLTTNEAGRLLTAEGVRSAQPAWSSDSKTLYFTADSDGVFNLYALTLASGEIKRLTNLVGGAFAPDASPDGKTLAYLSHSSRGLDLALLDLSTARTDAAGIALNETLALIETSSAPTITLKSAPYSAFPYLKPVYWLPDYTTDGKGSVYGAWTASQDPLDQQSFLAALFWSVGHNYPYGLLNYTFDAWYPTLTLAAGRLPLLYSGLLGQYDYWELNRYLDLSITQKLSYPLKKLQFSVGYKVEEVSSQIEAEDVGGSQLLADAPFTGSRNGLYASVLGDWTVGRASRFSVAPEGGRTLGLTLTRRSGSLGSDLNSTELFGFINEYLPLPPLPRWVLTLSGRGGYGTGDKTLQGLFQAGGAQTQFPLRGYPARVLRGDKLATGTAQLNFPLWSPYRGWSDNPFFLMHLDGALFFDAGRTWENPGDSGGVRKGAGGEARANFILGYYLPVTATAGVARGFDEGGETLAYFYLTVGGQSLGGLR